MPMDTQVELWVAVHIASDVYSRVRVDAAQDAVCVDGEALSISPLDKQVLMKALSVSSQVRVVSVCPQTQERALRYAAAMGAPQIFRINDCPRDAYVAAAEVAAFLKDRPQPVVLCGESRLGLCQRRFSPLALATLRDCSGGRGVRFSPLRGRSAVARSLPADGCFQRNPSREGSRDPFVQQSHLPQRAGAYPLHAGNDARHAQPGSPRPPGGGFLAQEGVLRLPDDARASFGAFSPPEDFVQMAVSSSRPCPIRGGSSSEGETPVFSGRILARVSTLEDPHPLSAQTEQVDRQPMPLHVDVRTAPLVVSGGMGVDPSLWPLLEQLARDGGGATACTRPVYQAGRRPYFEHVGQTGAKVAPALYLAVGISGALQHIAGMIRSRKVLAINTDPQAEIFKYADYGVVGDAGRVLPGLVEELRRRSGSLANASANNK